MDAQSETPPDSFFRRVFRRKKWVFLGGVFLFCAFLFVWNTWKGRGQYYGRPEALLPADTGLLVTWRDFSAFLRQANALEAVQQIRSDPDLKALMESDPEWLALAEQSDQPHYRLLALFAGDFVQTWLGREVSLALVPPAAGRADGRSGILIIARTDIGFEENLAETLARLSPQLQILTRSYRGHVLSGYRSEEPRNCFSWCRFGKTVVLSIRSDSWHWLEGVVDRQAGTDAFGEATVSLADGEAFAAASGWNALADGLEAFVEPGSLFRTLRYFPSSDAEGDGWGFWLDYLEEQWQGLEWAALRLRLDEGLRAEMLWEGLGGGGAAQPPGSERLAEKVAALPGDASLYAMFYGPGLGAGARHLWRRLEDSSAYGEEMPDLDAGWAAEMGFSLGGDFLPGWQDLLELAFTGLAPRLLLPSPQGLFQARMRSPEAARQLAEKAREARRSSGWSVMGRLLEMEYRTDGAEFIARVNASPRPASAEESALPALLGRTLADCEPAVPCNLVLLDFDRAHQQLRTVRNAALLWSADVRNNLRRTETLLAALRHLRALYFASWETDRGMRSLLVIQVQ